MSTARSALALRRLARPGRLGGGERLPPLRDLAETLQLSYATVSRGYGEAPRQRRPGG